MLKSLLNDPSPPMIPGQNFGQEKVKHSEKQKAKYIFTSSTHETDSGTSHHNRRTN